MASASLANHGVNSGDLVDLVSSSASTTVYPNDEAIVTVLNTRFRADLPYTRIATANLLVVNPYKTLANVNDLSAKEYEERCYKDTSLPIASSRLLQPHLYEFAAQIYLVMRRRNQSQSVITRFVLDMIRYCLLPYNVITEVSPARESRPVPGCWSTSFFGSPHAQRRKNASQAKSRPSSRC